MIDVFISYSGRASVTDNWLQCFRNSLVKCYKENYAIQLTVWDQVNNIDIGDNFVYEIDDALKVSTVFIMILDPGYLISPQAQDELNKYKEIRTNKQSPFYIIKVVKRKGEKEQQIRNFESNSIVMSFLSEINSDGDEVEYSETRQEYKNEIEKIVKSIREKADLEFKQNSYSKLLDYLARIKNDKKIYVPLTHYSLNNSRRNLLSQLNETIVRDTLLPPIKILPDDLTVSILTYEQLAGLVIDDHPNRDAVINSLLKASDASMIPIEYDNTSEAEDIKKNFLKQLTFVKAIAQGNANFPLFFLFNIPREIKPTSPFNDEIQNPAYPGYKNIARIFDTDIASFIAQYLIKLKELFAPVIEPAPCDKNIYLIKYDQGSLTNNEEQHILEIIGDINDNGFVLLENNDISNDFQEALKQHKRWLEIADGIIIYRGVTDGKWYIDRKGEVYKALVELKKQQTKRAVFIDPDQPQKDPRYYVSFRYDTIECRNPNLINFLNSI